jgi:ABC-2 type transport system ATP-binding protein
MSWGVSDVTVRFGDRTGLDAVTLEVPAGQVTGVVGGDGAGKTTLLRALAGALGVSDGSVRRPADDRIGHLSSTSGTYPDLTVDENLEFAALAYGVSAADARQRAADYLERTGLAAAHDRLGVNLSGGMRQKLGVIRAFLHRPELLVLDEPTTGVDPISRVDLWWLIAHAAAHGTAVVFSTTYLDEAERATSLLVLERGEPLAVGAPVEIVASIPGTVRSHRERPTGEEARRSWRRHATWRTWDPGGGDSNDPAATFTKCAGGTSDPAGGAARSTGGACAPSGRDDRGKGIDLQDAVTVLALRRELGRAADATGGAR